MTDQMNTSTVEKALRRVGELLDYHTGVDLLLVGGAAGMVTGVLSPLRTTADCDVMVYTPEEAMVAVELAAAKVAEEMDLPANWLNSDVQLRLDTLPDGWEARRVWVDTFGKLRVFAASRLDLIAMKVVAGRAQDLDDLRDMKVRRDEVGFVRQYLDALSEKGTKQQQIDDAVDVLETLELHDHE